MYSARQAGLARVTVYLKRCYELSIHKLEVFTHLNLPPSIVSELLEFSDSCVERCPSSKLLPECIFSTLKTALKLKKNNNI